MSPNFFIRLIALTTMIVLACSCKPDEGVAPGNENRWQKVVDIHPQDRTRVVQMMIRAENRLPSQSDHAALVLTCQQGETEAYVIWRQYLGAYDLDVTWRAGSDEEVTEQWTLSTDSEALFAPEPVKLIQQMMIYPGWLMKTTPFGSEPLTLIFDTSGLKQEVEDLRKACNW